MRNELIRKELEKKYTHVTFVKTGNEGKRYEHTVWFLNNEMEVTWIPTEWKIEEILYNIEMQKLAQIANKKHPKYHLFKRLMKEGKIELDYRLYKKMTLGKLEEIEQR